jgi:membrane protease YdiL (CAAX protease family)
MEASTEAEDSSIHGSRLDDKTAAGHANILGPVDPAAVRVAARRAAFRWWDPFLVLVIAAIAWLVGLVFLFGAVSVVWLLLGPNAKLGTVSTEFFVPLAAPATFYLALLLVMRSLAKRRGRTLFASYLPSIGVRPVIYAALSGVSLTGIYLSGIFGLSLTSFFQNHPMPHEVLPLPQSFGQLVAFGLLAVILAPLTEELYWRGLVLDCLQQKMAPWVSAAITAVLFSLSHVLFLIQPGIFGWMATAGITGLGLLAAFWVHCTRSLRPAIAAHASYNATIVLCAFFFR